MYWLNFEFKKTSVRIKTFFNFFFSSQTLIYSGNFFTSVNFRVYQRQQVDIFNEYF